MSFDTNIDTDPDSSGTGDLSPDQLRAQLAAAEERAQRLEQDVDRERTRLDSFLSRNPSDPERKQAAPIQPMPDPIENPDGYRQWMADRDARVLAESERRLQAHTAEIRADQAAAEERAIIWTSFQTKYARHAQQRDLASAAYNRLVSAGSLSKDPDRIADAVAREMDRMVGTPIANITAPPDRTGGTSAGERPAPQKSRGSEDGEAEVSIHSAATAFKLKHGLI